MRLAPDLAGPVSGVALGVVLGPNGLAVLTPRILDLIDPVVPVALATVGVLAVLNAPALDRTHLPAAGRGLVEGLVTTTLVTAGIAALGLALTPTAPVWVLATVAGCSALIASTAPAAVAVLAAALALAVAGTSAPFDWPVLVQASAIASVMAATGWLLISRQASPAERGVSMVATLLLIGGAADYLGVPALLAGAIAGLCWRRAVSVREIVLVDLSALRPSVATVLLLIAGARMPFTLDVVWLAMGYALLLVVSEIVLAIGKGSERADTSERHAQLPSLLLALVPAIVAARALGTDLAPTLGMVALGTLLSRLLRATWPVRIERA